MSDLISREVTLNILKERYCEGCTYYGVRCKSVLSGNCPIYNAIIAVDAVPAIDAEPERHGYWLWRDELIYVIGEPIEHETGWECSVCHTKLESYIYATISEGAEIDGYEPKMKYCPCCGAKMDADECTQIES